MSLAEMETAARLKPPEYIRDLVRHGNDIQRKTNSLYQNLVENLKRRDSRIILG
jgi:hypothetical protein